MNDLHKRFKHAELSHHEKEQKINDKQEKIVKLEGELSKKDQYIQYLLSTIDMRK